MSQEVYNKLKNRGLILTEDTKENYLKKLAEPSRQLNPNFWADKRVLITGINGFAGSHLTELLLKNKAKVAGIVRRQSVPDYSNLKGMTDQIKIYEGSLPDAKSLQDSIKEFEPEVVFHLGGQSFVPTSFRCPIETFDINILGTANLLESIRNLNGNIYGLLIAGSSEEYGLVYPDETPIKESNPLR